MPENQVKVGLRAARQTLEGIYVRAGLPAGEAAVLVDTMLDAELRGIRSHGLSRVKLTLDKIAQGSVASPVEPTPLSDRQAVASLDGHDGLGQWVAYRAMETAIGKAERYGVGAVSVRNSQHFGTAGYYANMAAERDMVGMAFTNASPRLAPWGGMHRMLGNNPWAIGLPTHSAGLPFLLDISNGVSSAGRIRLAIKRGEAIPDSWALDAKGMPTTDPVAALGGILLPFGQHKGYGITLAISMLTSLLAAGAPDAEVQTVDDPAARQHVSHFFIALNVAFFQPLEQFRQGMRELIERLHANPAAPGVERIYYPGERGFLQKREALAAGEMAVDAAVWQGILALPGA